jgi:hypothetical protein
VEERQQTLNAKLRGHYQYYGLPTNSRSIWKFYRGVCRIWRKWLSRRTRGNRMTWEKYEASSVAIRCCFLGSSILGAGRGVAPEEPAAWKSARWDL